MTATLDQLGKTSNKTRVATSRVLTALAENGKAISQVFGAGPSGEHATGYATDFMVYNDKALGDWIANWIWSNRNALGVAYIMWQHRIISTNPNGKYGPAGQWNWVEERGNPTQNHMDHVHVTWTTAMPSAELSKPVAPTPKPKPPAKPNPRPWLIPSQRGVYIDKLRIGEGNSTSVYLYQLALRRYLNKYANKYNPSGATGYYGSETVAMTQAVYRDLNKKQPRGGWTPTATTPGPGLLRTLGLANLGHS